MGKVCALAVAAVLLVAPLSAQAQQGSAQLTPAQQDAALDKMDCVYNAITDNDLIALARAYETEAVEVPDAVALSVNTVSKGCTAQHGWDEHKSTMAYEAAVAGAVVDVLMGDLEDAGMQDVSKLLSVWDGLSDEDFGVLLAEGWRAKPDFVARIRPTLVGAGVPDTTPAVSKALTVLEAATYGSLLSEEWLAAETGATAAR